MKTCLTAALVTFIATQSPVALAQSTAPPPAVPQVATPSLQAPDYTRVPRTVYRPFLPATPLGPNAQSKYYEQAYQISLQYGRCAAHLNPERVRLVLDANPNTPGERVNLNRLISNVSGCLPYGYRPQVIFMRGSLAEALYRRQPVAAAVHGNGTTPQQLSAFLDAESVRGLTRLQDDLNFVNYANCFVIRAPATVRAVLLSDHGSVDERRHMEDLLKAAPGCSRTSHLPPAASTSFMRAYLAESALRWSTYA